MAEAPQSLHDDILVSLDRADVLSAGHVLGGVFLKANAGFDLVNHAHLMRKGVVRLPLGTGRGGGLLQHLVNLFQRETLRLWDEKVGEQQAQEEGTSPNEEDLHLQVSLVVVNHVWSDNRDHTVPEPVRGSGKSNTLGSNGQRVDFTNNNPSRGTPGGRKGGNVETGKNDETGTPVDQKKHSLVVWSLAKM